MNWSRQKQKKSKLFCIIVFIFISSNQIHPEKVRIKGLDISYSENNQNMIASGNAQLIHPDFKIFADIIKYNQKTGVIEGKNNIEMIQENQIILSEKFNYNVKTNVIYIEDLRLELTTKIKNQQIYATAKNFKDHGHFKSGKEGILTTCNYDPPHYFFKANEFNIYPEKKIIGQNVSLVNPVLFLPLGFWTPAYIFELGKRKVIYLMPVIGSNTIEGGFFKSQIDYVLNDHWTGAAYVDYLSNKGIGLGTKLNYTNYKNLDGNIYYYGVADTEFNIKEWKQVIKLSNEDTLKTHIQSKNMYLIQGGTSQSDKNNLIYEKRTIDATHKAVYSFNQSHLETIKPKDYHVTYTKKGDDKSEINLSYKRSETSIDSDAINLANKDYIGYDILNRNNINYYQKEVSATDARQDSYLKTQNSLSKRFNFGTVNTAVDVYLDTDGDTVTEDIKNHIVQKTPEIDVMMLPLKLNRNLQLNQKLQYGFYSENYFITSLNKQRIYQQSRLNINQDLTSGYSFNFLNGRFSTKTFYNQFYYGSGDQTFTFGNNASYQTNSFSFLMTDTTHSRTWIPENGNTPFYFDERDQRERNELKEKITLYFQSPSKYSFSYSSGYNWIVNYQLDNVYELKVRPNKVFGSLLRTTYLLQQHKYSPLVSRFDIKPSKMFETSIQANYDLNEGEIINLNHIISGSTSSTWENRWIFRAYFTYSPRYKQDYQLQTLTLTKDLHERKLTLIYNRLLEEYRFQFTINAFPENNLGFTTNQYESFRLEGVFDDQSIQR